MNARTSWSAKADRKGRRKSGSGNEIPARRSARRPLRRGGPARPARARQPPARRRDARPAPAPMSPEELERAVQKLATGLEAIERQSRAARPLPERRADARQPADRDFVTYSLDRLEARLEALSKRLAHRASSDAAPEPAVQATSSGRRTRPAPAAAAPSVPDPSFAADPVADSATDAAAERRAAAARALREAEAAAEQRRRAEALGSATPNRSSGSEPSRRRRGGRSPSPSRNCRGRTPRAHPDFGAEAPLRGARSAHRGTADERRREQDRADPP